MVTLEGQYTKKERRDSRIRRVEQTPARNSRVFPTPAGYDATYETNALAKRTKTGTSVQLVLRTQRRDVTPAAVCPVV